MVLLTVYLMVDLSVYLMVCLKVVYLVVLKAEKMVDELENLLAVHLVDKLASM